MNQYDVIVIGGGPPGEIAAQYAIQGSDRTAVIVEHELLGAQTLDFSEPIHVGAVRHRLERALRAASERSDGSPDAAGL